MSPKNEEASQPKVREALRWLGAIVGVLASAAGLITFFALDVPELLGWHRQSIRPAAEGEVLVIVVDFGGDTSIEADTRIYQALAERVDTSDLEDVRVERLEGVTPLISSEAQAIGEEYGATLVIWGTADSYGITPRYEVVRHQEIIHTRTDPGVVLATDLPAFSAYVVQGAPREFDYLMLFSLGQIAYFGQDYEEAIDLFDEALGIDLGDRGASLNLATVYFYRGFAHKELAHLEIALADYDRAIELNPTFSLAYYNRGILSRTLGDLEAALADYNRAIASNPRYAPAYNNRGLVYRALGDSQAALADYSQAITLDPTFATPHYNRGLLYYNLGNLEAALADYDRAIELDSEYVTAYNNRGLVYAALGNIEAAIADYDQAIELDPMFALAYNNRGFAYYGLGDLETALDDAARAIELDPQLSAAYDTRGLIYHDLGNLESALADFDRALELTPNLAITYYNRGLTHEALGHIDDALADYMQFLTMVTVENSVTTDAHFRIEALGGQTP